MIKWSYDKEQYESSTINGQEFQIIPVGPHRVRIETVEEVSSKSGKDMFRITLAVSGYTSRPFYFLVFDEDKPEMTNKKLGDIYESFGIPHGNLNPKAWEGKVGVAQIKHEIYNDKERAYVNWFIAKDRAEILNLPSWVEKKRAENPSIPKVPF